MAKLTNTTKGDFGLPNAGIIIPAGTTLDDIDDEALDVDLKNKVVKAWVDNGWLVVGDYEAPEDDDEDDSGDGYDKLSKAKLIERADELDLEFDEKKATKAELIDLIRAKDAENKAAAEA